MSQSDFMKEFNQIVGKHRDESATPKPPKGWEEYAEFTEAIGEAIVSLPSPKATHHDLLVSSGFDPREWRISGPVQTRKWMSGSDKSFLYYYKFNVVAGESPEDREVHVQDLVDRLLNSKRPDPTDTSSEALTSGVYVVALADWQVGKVVGSFGTPELVERVKDLIDRSVVRLYELREQGYYFDQGLIVGLGDLIERCTGSYPNQPFTVDLNNRDQLRIARELIYYAIDTLLPHLSFLTVACVGGNHGERRDGGRIVTDKADNDDVGVFETVKEAYDRAGVDNIQWIIPQDELLVELDILDIKVAITHGHLFKSGASAQVKARNWWRDQVFGQQTDAQILLHGHYHHHSVNTYGRRTAIMAPATDGGSDWYRDISGEESIPGLMTLVITPDNPLGWDHLKVLWADA